MPLHASARRLGHTHRHEIVIDHRHRLVTDEPIRLGGTDTGPSPHELIPAALASCIATTIVVYAERKGWDVGDVAVDVTYDHKAQPRRFEVEVMLPDDLGSEQLERLRRVADSCPVHRALQGGFTFEQRLVTAPRESHGAAA